MVTVKKRGFTNHEKCTVKRYFSYNKERKEAFFSILLITALGVAMFTGLRASCNDLRYSADALYDEQALFVI